MKKIHSLLLIIIVLLLAGCGGKEEISREEYIQTMSEELAYIYHSEDYFTQILDVQSDSLNSYSTENDKLIALQDTYHANLNTVKNRLDYIDRFYDTYEILEDFKDVSQDYVSLYNLVVENIEKIELNHIDWDVNEAWDNSDYTEVVDLKLEIIDGFFYKGITSDEDLEEELWRRFALSCDNSY